MAAIVKNDWVGYLDRSYQQIKQSLLARVTKSNPELTDHSESNIFVIIISMIAGVFEMLGFYVDNVAQESYLATAERLTSVIKHSQPLDYRIKTRYPEGVDIAITWSAPVPSDFVIAAGSTIVSNTGITYRTPVDFTVLAGSLSSLVPFQEFTETTNSNLGTTDGSRNQRFSLGTTYVHKSARLEINGVDYEEVDSFAYSSADDLHYIIDVLEDGNAYIVLGDGINGKLPTNGETVAIINRTTLGPDGKVSRGEFDESQLTLDAVLPGGITVTDANSLEGSSGGTLYEGIEDIRRNAPRALRTQERMVTREDHKDIIELVPGVAKAAVDFCCGKEIDIYIVPEGGGIANNTLINDAQTEAELKKMVATFPNVLPAGETSLVLGATITAKKRKSIIETRQQVLDALLEFGEVDNQEINGAIRLSDLQALIDNQSNVDFVDITRMYTKPYARPKSGTNPLVWINTTTEGSTAIHRWRIEYDGTNMRVFKDEVFQISLPIGLEFNDTPNSGFKFTINAGTYVAGNSWEFTTYPFLRNLQLDDFTIFKIQEVDLELTVLAAPTTTQSGNC